MEKQEKNQRGCKATEPDLFLQWGNRKRLRCVRVRDPEISYGTYGGRIRRRIASGIVTSAFEKESSLLQPPTRLTRNSEAAAVVFRPENQKSAAGLEDRCYATRGSVGGLDENEKASTTDEGERGVGVGVGDENRGGGGVVWPKLYMTLTSKEKEEDFVAMKGCKPPQRPKKRAKIIQRTLLLVSPGAWLSEMCQERYEVREKKSSKKQRPRGLKAMGSMESDSE
ncbi:hypothetical protein U1Q18_012699 [Sarracenia purpurea var. burkii]